MTTQYPLEALLRPPVELWSAACAFSCALIAGLAPWAMMMTPSVAYATAALLTGFGLSRTRDAWRVLRYQRNMRKLPRYDITARAIPVSRHRLFLGKGFLWQQQHSQRLRDTLNPRVRHYIEPSALYQLARRLEIRWEHTPVLNGFAKLLHRSAWWNPVAPLPPVGGKAAIHAVEWREQTVTMDVRERVGHMLVLGTTRVGKTRLAELLITQDIARGDTVIVFDPKGDAELMKRVVAEAKRAGRSKALYIFHLGYPEISCRYNAIGNFSRITEVATRLTNPLPSEGNSAAFREFAWRFTNMIAVALVKMGKRPDYQLITRYITHIEPLLTDYYRHWLPEVAPPDWEQQVQRMAATSTNATCPLPSKAARRKSLPWCAMSKSRAFTMPSPTACARLLNTTKPTSIKSWPPYCR
jgi:conjugative coupling factor TraD (TOL family)